MATSGTATFNLEFSLLAEDAFLMAGRPMRSGYDLALAARCFNLLTQELSNRGLNFWTIEEREETLVAGTETYALDSDTVDILEASIRENDGQTSQIDYQMKRVSIASYANLSNKRISTRPTQFCVSRSASPSITLYPIPDQAYILKYWIIRRIEDLGKPSNDVDMPARFLPVITAGLGYYISMRDPETRPNADRNLMEFDRQFELAAGEDRERASSYFVPGFS